MNATIHGVPATPPHNSEASSAFKLRGNMGTLELMFTVLAFSAPLGVVCGYLSYNISFGLGVPIAFVCVGVLMLCFATGFTNMTRRVPRPGAFYTYITEGLGRPMGLGAAFLALVTYWFNIVSALVFAGVAVNNLITSFLSAAAVPWWAWSLPMLIAVWTMSYFNVSLSAKVLSIVLVLEIIAIIIFDVTIIANGGPEGHTLEPWNPANLIDPKIGLIFLFTIGLFNGFEATAIYRDEVRDPLKTIPRATYLVIIFLGTFYAISAYALILAAGAGNAVEAAQTNPDAMMPDATLKYLGVFVYQVVLVLIATSMFASSLSLQNILSRYAHSLSVDGVLPKILAAVHPRHGSPYRSAVAIGAVLLLSILMLMTTGGKYVAIYAAAAGLAFYGMLLLLFMTSVAVLVYFNKACLTDSKWKTFYAPLIAAVSIGCVLVVASLNFDLLVDAPAAVLWGLVGLIYLVILAGIAIALNLKGRGSPVYARIGRRID